MQQDHRAPGPVGFVVEVDAVYLGVLAGALHVGRPIGLHAGAPSELIVMRAEYEDSVRGPNSSDGVYGAVGGNARYAHNRTVGPSEIVAEFWRRIQSRDWDGVGDLLADDFVLEWPNARVRIRGREYWVEERYEKPAADRSRWFEPM